MFTTGFLPFSEPHRILQPRPGSSAVGGWPGQNYKLYTKAVPHPYSVFADMD